MPHHLLLAFILLGLSVLWASWFCGLVSGINLEEILCHYCFCSFFSPPSGLPVVICDTFVIHSSSLFCSCFFVVVVCFVPWPPNLSPLFSFFFFFALGSFCRHILNHRVSFPQLCLLICPTKAFFISVSVLICDISLFDFSLEFPSVCLSYTSVLVCCLLFPVEPSACWS